MEFFNPELITKTLLVVLIGLALSFSILAILLKKGVGKKKDLDSDYMLSNRVRKDIQKGKSKFS